MSDVHAGVLKYKSISAFFDSILDGTADLTALKTHPPKESHKPTPDEDETERKQEAGREALLHGGFSDVDNLEKAATEEDGTDYGVPGRTTRTGDTSKNGQTWEKDNGEEDAYEREVNPIHRAICIQLERDQKDAKDVPRVSIPESGDTDQVVLELHTTAESAHLSATINSPQASETCISESVADRVVPSCAAPVAEGVLPSQGVTTPEVVHVKDEL